MTGPTPPPRRPRLDELDELHRDARRTCPAAESTHRLPSLSGVISEPARLESGGVEGTAVTLCKRDACSVALLIFFIFFLLLFSQGDVFGRWASSNDEMHHHPAKVVRCTVCGKNNACNLPGCSTLGCCNDDSSNTAVMSVSLRHGISAKLTTPPLASTPVALSQHVCLHIQPHRPCPPLLPTQKNVGKRGAGWGNRGTGRRRQAHGP